MLNFVLIQNEQNIRRIWKVRELSPPPYFEGANKSFYLSNYEDSNGRKWDHRNIIGSNISKNELPFYNAIDKFKELINDAGVNHFSLK